MHILMTDVLTCPRCGPQYGLILLADEVRDRRVLTGRLGCANCREKYEIREGAVHFPAAGGAAAPGTAAAAAGAESPGKAADVAAAADPTAERPAEAAAADADADPAAEHPGDAEAAVRLAALMGVQQGGGHVLLAGTAAAQAGGVAELAPGLEVAAVTAPAHGVPPREPGVSHILVSGAVLPFASDRMAGVALGGAAAATYLEEGARCLGPVGRLVLYPAPPEAVGRLAAAGLRVVAAEGDTVVAARSRG